jgi:hypothetical protein
VITTSERDFVNHWAMFGTNAVLHKLGTKDNKWTVGFADCQHPGVFKTKREAAEAASKMVCAIGLRRYES